MAINAWQKSSGKKSPRGIDIIQQWQYTGRPAPEMLTDAAFENARSAGITSIQSYVTWQEIEPEEGVLDFSAYDDLVRQCKKHGLGWVPFIILGPNYSVPDWFHGSEKSLYAACLEHGIPSRIQSIWNPHLPVLVEKFLRLLAERYRDSGIVSSIILGISGNWGESLYPIDGCFRPGFHTHLGWWCGDPYAHNDYRDYLEKKYSSIDRLNREHAKHYRNFSEIAFPLYSHPGDTPAAGLRKLASALHARRSASGFIIRRLIRKWLIEKTRNPLAAKFLRWKEWHDFVSWYMEAMTRWCDFWLGAARSCFPGQRIYLVSGGDGYPQGGAIFSEQTKTAVKFHAGIRITNQTDTFADSFIRVRLSSTASRFYASFYNTEEAWINNPGGVSARIFDAATSGADGLYCKNFIGIGYDACTRKEFPVGMPTGGAENLKLYGAHITGEHPLIETAVLFPSTSIIFGTQIPEVFESCKKLREIIDFDMVDEVMISDGILPRYRFLVLVSCKWLREETLLKINSWVREGGVLVCPSRPLIKNIDSPGELPDLLRTAERVQSNGRGYVFQYPGPDGSGYTDFVRSILVNDIVHAGYASALHAGGLRPGMFASFRGGTVLLYNESPESFTGPIEIRGPGIDVTLQVTCGAGAITAYAFRNIHGIDK